MSPNTVGAMRKKKVYVPVREHPEINFLGKNYGHSLKQDDNDNLRSE
jgi:hypothetical protein